MTNLEVLYRDLATEYQLPVATVEQVCRSQFRFVRESMEGDRFPLVRLPYLGSFKILPTKLERYKNSQWWDKENQKTIKKP